MSGKIAYLPKLEILKVWIETDPESILHYSKYDFFNGDRESIRYILEKIWEYRLKKYNII